jgi:hypothetical protein
MDDPRWQQFFVDPQLIQQRRYEAIRAVILEGEPAQDVAARFGFTHGTLRNVIAQFRACIREGRTPPFSPLLRADGPPPITPGLTFIVPPSPIADCLLRPRLVPSALASPDSFCSCLCSLNSASIASSAKRAIPAHT